LPPSSRGNAPHLRQPRPIDPGGAHYQSTVPEPRARGDVGAAAARGIDALVGWASMFLPDWRLPRGVSRSVWEFAHDRSIARDEDRHLADAPLLEFDRETVARWFATPGKLIDLGCGTGRSLAEFSRRGFECVGVDLSRESLAVAAERTTNAA